MKGVLVKKILEYFLRAVVYLSIFSATAFFFSIFIDNKRVASQPPENPLTWNISPEEFERNLNEQLYNNKVHLPAIFRGNNYPNNPTEAASVNNDGNVTPVPVEQLEQPIETPTVIQNPYDFMRIRFDDSQQVDIVFFTHNEQQIPLVFIPGIPKGNTDEHPAGSGYSRVLADPYGNIVINPHSGNQCFFNQQYEAEKLREYLEGGNCIDTKVSYTLEETQRRLSNIQNVVMYQNDKSIMMDIVAFNIISANLIGDELNMEARAIAELIGFQLNERSVVLITCAWSWEGKEYSRFNDDYTRAERIIMVLQPQT